MGVTAPYVTRGKHKSSCSAVVCVARRAICAACVRKAQCDMCDAALNLDANVGGLRSIKGSRDTNRPHRVCTAPETAACRFSRHLLLHPSARGSQHRSPATHNTSLGAIREGIQRLHVALHVTLHDGQHPLVLVGVVVYLQSPQAASAEANGMAVLRMDDSMLRSSTKARPVT